MYLVLRNHTSQLQDGDAMGAGLDPGANNAVVVIRRATADCLDTARLTRISQPVVGRVVAGDVGRLVEDGHLVPLVALVGTGQSVNKQNIERPHSRAVKGRVPACRLHILTEDESLDISRKLDNRYKLLKATDNLNISKT